MKPIIRLNPLTLKKLKRFRSIKRGYYSFLIFVGMVILSIFAAFYINSRALVVRYHGEYFFPVLSGFHSGDEFGLGYPYEANYRELKKQWETQSEDNWLLMPLVPYNPYENEAYQGYLRPAPPLETGHLLGTDSTGRDILARLVYGFRIAIFFSLAYMLLTYLIGVAIGCLMGYFGGLFDLIFQRLIEIWSNMPFLYTVIIVFSVTPSTVGTGFRASILLLILVLFSWTGMTYYMRTGTYREKARDYVAAAQVLGASTTRIIFTHILPNTLSIIVTFMPFTVVGGITVITALDFIGFGLPPPTPSIGEMLKQGTANLRVAPWIVTSAFASLVLVLTLVTFIGEAVREAFDPRKYTYYK